MKNIIKIIYPNTDLVECAIYEKGINADEFKYIYKDGEMASIRWIQVIKDNRVIAEIKESVCNIYGDDPIEQE